MEDRTIKLSNLKDELLIVCVGTKVLQCTWSVHNLMLQQNSFFFVHDSSIEVSASCINKCDSNSFKSLLKILNTFLFLCNSTGSIQPSWTKKNGSCWSFDLHAHHIYYSYFNIRISWSRHSLSSWYFKFGSLTIRPFISPEYVQHSWGILK